LLIPLQLHRAVRDLTTVVGILRERHGKCQFRVFPTPLRAQIFPPLYVLNLRSQENHLG
jgi:hypothetical protein